MSRLQTESTKERSKKIIYDTGTLAFDKDAIGTSVFLTKDEAEKRMEELGKHIDGYY